MVERNTRTFGEGTTILHSFSRESYFTVWNQPNLGRYLPIIELKLGGQRNYVLLKGSTQQVNKQLQLLFISSKTSEVLERNLSVQFHYRTGLRRSALYLWRTMDSE